MLNIKQAKPGVSDPEATRAALQDSRESPRVYMARLGVGNRRKGGGMSSAKSPPFPAAAVGTSGWIGCLGGGAQLLPDLGANCAAPTRGEVSPLGTSPES